MYSVHVSVQNRAVRARRKAVRIQRRPPVILEKAPVDLKRAPVSLNQIKRRRKRPRKHSRRKASLLVTGTLKSLLSVTI